MGVTELRVVLQGIDKPVVITDAHARILARNPIPASAWIAEYNEGGGDTIRTDLDLDRVNGSATYFRDHSISLQPGETVTIDLNAAANKSAVVWDLVFDVVLGGEQRTVTVTRARGLHFRTSPGAADDKYSRGFFSDIEQPNGGWTPCRPKVPRDCLPPPPHF